MQTTAKRCPGCDTIKTLDQFYRDKCRSKGIGGYCKECQGKKNAEYRKRVDYPAMMARYMRNEYKRLKMNALKKVARSDKPLCVNCQCSFMPLLQINHKDGGGRIERKKYKNHRDFYRAIVRERRSIEDLEVLCLVCNAKHYAYLKYAKQYNVEYKG